MRIAQAHQVGRQERRRRHLADPIDGEGIHRLEHAVLDAVEQFEIADDFLGGERLELEFAAGLFLDRAAQALNVLRPTPAGQEVCTFQVVVSAASALRI